MISTRRPLREKLERGVLLATAVVYLLGAAWLVIGAKAGTMPMMGVGTPISSGASYTGPVDSTVTTTSHLVDCWSLRACDNTVANAGATTTAVIDVLGTTTSTGCTIYLKGDGTGGLDFSTAGAGGVGNQCLLGATTFCTVTNASCTVSKFYGQISGNTLSQATAASQPTLTFNCVNTSLPCLTFGGPWLFNTGLSSFTAGSFSAVAIRTSTLTVNAILNAPTPNSSNGLDFYSTSGDILLRVNGTGNQSILTSVTENAWHALAGVINGTSTLVYADDVGASACTTGTCTAVSGQTVSIGANSNGNAGTILTGKVTEAIVWNNSTLLSTTQIGNLCHNQYGYWGTSVSC